MKKLTELGIKYYTDKAYAHSFTEIYHDFFSNYKSPKILEIGVYNGGSMQMLNEFYDYDCSIVGVDNGFQLSYKPNHKNISIVIADQNFPEDLASKLEGDFDIIIDDGSHQVEHQIKCFEKLQHRVKSGGLYVIEDLHCCFYPEEFNKNNVENTIDYLKKIQANTPSHIKSVDIFSDVDLSEANRYSHITSVIQFL